MNRSLKRVVGTVVGAVALAACGGGESKSDLAEPAITSPAATSPATNLTSPPSSAEQTTTTAPDYTYELTAGDVAYDEAGDYVTDIPDDGTFPWDAQNPAHPEALNLRAFSELPAGTELCGWGWGGPGVNLDLTTDGRVAIYQHMIGDMTEPQIALAVHASITSQSQYGLMWQFADASGVVNYPDGTWSTDMYVTLGSC
jgi:hypothetical protein